MSDSETPVAVPQIATEQYPGTALLRARLAQLPQNPFPEIQRKLDAIKADYRRLTSRDVHETFQPTPLGGS